VYGNAGWRLDTAEMRFVELVVRADMVTRDRMPEMVRSALRRVIPAVPVRIGRCRTSGSRKTYDGKHQRQNSSHVTEIYSCRSTPSLDTAHTAQSIPASRVSMVAAFASARPR
jgi:hypothetical protein